MKLVPQWKTITMLNCDDNAESVSEFMVSVNRETLYLKVFNERNCHVSCQTNQIYSGEYDSEGDSDEKISHICNIIPRQLFLLNHIPEKNSTLHCTWIFSHLLQVDKTLLQERKQINMKLTSSVVFL